MAQRLLVKEPFGDYARGDRITASAEMRRALKSHPDHVLREDVPEEPKRRARKAPSGPASGKPKVSRGVTVTDPAMPDGSGAK